MFRSILSLSCFCAFLLATASSATAQAMYEDDVLDFSQYRYSANGQYRIGFACIPGYCAPVQEQLSGGSWAHRGKIFPDWSTPFVYLQMDWGNLIWYKDAGGFVDLSLTYSESGENWLNIQDDGNVVIYDSSNNPLWTPACEWIGDANQSYYFSIWPFNPAQCP